MSPAALGKFLLGAIGLPMANDPITAKRHRVEHVDVYEVFGDELDRIEQEGISVGTDLQFALFWLPIAITLTATLCRTSIVSLKIYIGFFIVTVISTASGFTSLFAGGSVEVHLSVY